MTEQSDQTIPIPSHEEFLQELLESPSPKTAEFLAPTIIHLLSQEDGYVIAGPAIERIANDPNNLYLTMDGLGFIAHQVHNKEAFVSIGRIMLRRSDCTIGDIDFLYQRSIVLRANEFESECLKLLLQHPRITSHMIHMILFLYGDRYINEEAERMTQLMMSLHETRMQIIARHLLPDFSS